MRKLIGALAAILVLILAEDLHAMPLGGAVDAVSTFSPVEKITCWRPYCPPARHRIICGRYGCWCDPCGSLPDLAEPLGSALVVPRGPS